MELRAAVTGVRYIMTTVDLVVYKWMGDR